MPHADEHQDRDQAEQVVRGPARREADGAGGNAERADEPDREAQPTVEREETGPVHRVRPRVARFRATFLGGLHLGCAGDRRMVIAVVGDGDQARAALGRDQQRLGARPEHTVAALQLGAIDSEVGLVDQLVGVRAVLRIAGDADRDGGANRLARRLDVEGALRDRAADPLGDLERLLGWCLGEQNGELLPAEARRDVVVAQLRTEDLSDPFQDGITGEVAVRVVDVAEQIEVGHDQRHRPLEALGAADLLRQCRGEVAGVEEARLRVDARLRLQCRHAERAVDQEERRERERDEPRIRLPEGVHGDPERGEDEVGGEVFGVEETGLTEAEAAGEPEHHREERVVDGHEDETRGDTGNREAQCSVGEPRVLEQQDAAYAPRRHRRQQVVEDIERLQVPAVAHLQPLRDHLHHRHEGEQLRGQDQGRRDQEDDVRVVGLVGRGADDEETGNRCGGGEDQERRPVVRRLHASDERQRGARRGQSHEHEVDPRIARQPLGPA